MVPAFDKVAFSVPVNAISPPVKSPFGYHIIQVEARTARHKRRRSRTRRREITDMLRQQQEAPLIQPFLQGLQQKATIVVHDPQFAELFPSPPPSARRHRVGRSRPSTAPTK